MPEPRIGLEPTRDGALWQRLVDGTPGATAYHDWEFLDFQQDLLDVAIERYVVLRDDEPVGVFPVPRRSRRAVDSPYIPFPYLGPLTPAATVAPAVAALRRRQPRSGLVLARFDVGPSMTDADSGTARAIQRTGATVHEDATVVIDLAHRSAETLFARFSRARRSDVRRAARDGSAVRPARPGEVAELLPAGLQEAYEAHGKPSPYPADIGERLEAWMVGRPWVFAMVGTVHDEPAGVLTALSRHATAVAWVGSSLRRFRRANPNVLMYQGVMEWAIADGCDVLDLCGWVDDGVAKYKLDFGGERRDYLSVESSLVPQTARRGLQRAKALVGR